jgi:predicted amidophosphoribosyltransferase
VRPELTGTGAHPAIRASLASELNLSIPAISPMSQAAVTGPIPVSASSCGGRLGDQVAQLLIQLVGAAGQLSDAARLIARDTTRALAGARERRRASWPWRVRLVRRRVGIFSSGHRS